jgi:hypothetical protein
MTRKTRPPRSESVTRRRRPKMGALRMTPQTGVEMTMDLEMNLIRRTTANTRMRRKAKKRRSWSQTSQSR